MAARLSTRISLRWLPDSPFEPTDTIVLNIGSYFMDLRIRKWNGEIDWAMAGERMILSEDPLKCKWIHTIDSRGYEEPDEGTFKTLDNGDQLETGEMACPEKGGAITAYEEVWRGLPVAAAKRFPYAWILQSVDASAKDLDGTIFLGKIGGEFVMMRSVKGGAFSASRQVWIESEERWREKYSVNNSMLPCISGVESVDLQGDATWKVGDLVQISHRTYRVVAWEDLGSLAKAEDEK